MPRPVRREISRSDERPPIRTATFTSISPRSRGTFSRRAQAHEGAIAPEELRHDGELGTMRAPRERGARGLEQLAALEPQGPADRSNGGFKPLSAPFRKTLELGRERRAQRP